MNKKIFCDECGERIHRYYYEIPISNTGYGKRICHRCIEQNYKVNLVDKEEKNE